MASVVRKEEGEEKAGTPAEPKDLDLAERIRGGDDAAFAVLVTRYHGSLVRLAMGFVKSRAQAEEAVQDTWLAVLAGLEGFEGRSSVKTWIFRILVNRSITAGAKEGRSVPMSSLGAGDDDPIDASRFTAGFWTDPPQPWDAAAEARVLQKELTAILDAELKNLPANQQAVVTLRDVEGVDAEDVCVMLGISEANQRVLLHRGRAKLRAAVERRLAESPPGGGSAS